MHEHRLHDVVPTKAEKLFAVCVDPLSGSDEESVLDDGESLSDFIATCVCSGVDWRRTLDAVLAGAPDAVNRESPERRGMPLE
jgi:hypothetical protein